MGVWRISQVLEGCTGQKAAAKRPALMNLNSSVEITASAESLTVTR